MRRMMTAGASALWLAAMGCGTTFQPGLANAPALGGTPVADTRVHDVIANGPDSCGRLLEPDPGPLRHRLLPCRREPVQTAGTAFVPLGAHDDEAGLHWLERHYSRWTCDAEGARSPGVLVPRSPLLSAVGACGPLH
jgi:hypothetical protein